MWMKRQKPVVYKDEKSNRYIVGSGKKVNAEKERLKKVKERV